MDNRSHQINHFILTRFNVNHPELEDTAPDTGIDKRWLAHRMTYFEDACAPSIASQDLKNFCWLVFLRPDTPEPYRERIDRCVSAAGGRLILAYDGTAAEAARAIGEHPVGSIIMTTRLDNDDALAFDYVRTVQSVQVPPPLVINPYLGSQRTASARVRHMTHTSSPFITFVERADGSELRTCWSFGHRFPPSDAAFIDLREPRLWMQGIHDRNISNPRRLGPLLSTASVRSRFHLSPTYVRSTSQRLAVASRVATWLILGKRHAVNVVRRTRARARARRSPTRRPD